jgi:hypothetical protein
MRSQLEHAIKYKCTTLEKTIAPVPTIICNYVVGFRLDPEVERNKDNTANPTGIGKAIGSQMSRGAHSEDAKAHRNT